MFRTYDPKLDFLSLFDFWHYRWRQPYNTAWYQQENFTMWCIGSCKPYCQNIIVWYRLLTQIWQVLYNRRVLVVQLNSIGLIFPPLIDYNFLKIVIKVSQVVTKLLSQNSHIYKINFNRYITSIDKLCNLTANYK